PQPSSENAVYPEAPGHRGSVHPRPTVVVRDRTGEVLARLREGRVVLKCVRRDDQRLSRIIEDLDRSVVDVDERRRVTELVPQGAGITAAEVQRRVQVDRGRQ